MKSSVAKIYSKSLWSFSSSVLFIPAFLFCLYLPDKELDKCSWLFLLARQLQKDDDEPREEFAPLYRDKTNSELKPWLQNEKELIEKYYSIFNSQSKCDMKL